MTLSITGQGSCWIYDTQFLAEGIFWACIVVKGISSLGFLLALILYKPPPGGEDGDEVVIDMDIDKDKPIKDLDNGKPINAYEQSGDDNEDFKIVDYKETPIKASKTEDLNSNGVMSSTFDNEAYMGEVTKM